VGSVGTVTGMVNSFTVIALKGNGDPQLLAGGISEALFDHCYWFGYCNPNYDRLSILSEYNR